MMSSLITLVKACCTCCDPWGFPGVVYFPGRPPRASFQGIWPLCASLTKQTCWNLVPSRRVAVSRVATCGFVPKGLSPVDYHSGASGNWKQHDNINVFSIPALVANETERAVDSLRTHRRCCAQDLARNRTRMGQIQNAHTSSNKNVTERFFFHPSNQPIGPREGSACPQTHGPSSNGDA